MTVKPVAVLGDVAYFFDVAEHVAGIEELRQDDGGVGDADEHGLGGANVLFDATELRPQLQITDLHGDPPDLDAESPSWGVLLQRLHRATILLQNNEI